VNLGWIGIWLLVIGAVAVIVELALMGLWTARLVRKSRRLSERLQADQARMQADVERLHAAIAETRALWQPYRRLLRWLSHPIAVALIQSYARRRVAPR
jgi:hypothetical protein